jgi:uncharacterized protein YukE
MPTLVAVGLVSDERLHEAAAALRSSEDRLATAGRRLEGRVSDMRWRGYGADRFRRRATDRLAQLTELRRQLDELSRELQRAAAAVRLAAAERARLEQNAVAR